MPTKKVKLTAREIEAKVNRDEDGSIKAAWDFVARWNTERGDKNSLKEGGQGFALNMPCVVLGGTISSSFHLEPTEESLIEYCTFINKSGNGYGDKALNERFYMLQNKTLLSIIEDLSKADLPPNSLDVVKAIVDIIKTKIVKPVV